MAAGKKVNVTVQVLLVSLVPFANVWAFYRIRRIRRMAAYVAVPAAAIIAVALLLFNTSVMGQECAWTLDGIGPGYAGFGSVAGSEMSDGTANDIGSTGMAWHQNPVERWLAANPDVSFGLTGMVLQQYPVSSSDKSHRSPSLAHARVVWDQVTMQCPGLDPWDYAVMLLLTGWIAMHAWQVCLIHRWSGEWNDRFGDHGSEEPRGA